MSVQNSDYGRLFRTNKGRWLETVETRIYEKHEKVRQGISDYYLMVARIVFLAAVMVLGLFLFLLESAYPLDAYQNVPRRNAEDPR